MSRQIATVLGLKGAQRIVLEELGRSLRDGDDVSVMLLAQRTNYCPTTVWLALQDLQDQGLVRMEQQGRGLAAQYEITGEARRHMGEVI